MVSIGIMNTQINLRLEDNLLESAKTYSQLHGYGNVQEFIKETIRQKIFDEPDLTGEELSLILKIAKVSEEKKLFKSEEELFKKLRKWLFVWVNSFRTISKSTRQPIN